jgi:biofilm protein TabA
VHRRTRLLTYHLRNEHNMQDMIVDRIESSTLYLPLHRVFAKAFAVLAEPELARKPDGRYSIDGDDAYYIIQHYTTKPVDLRRFESHKKYIDIQVLLAGEEMLGYTPTAGLEVVVPYDETKDIMFYHAQKVVTWMRLEPGIFCLLFPDDAHLPCCQVTGPAPVHKIVFKIRV